MFVPPLFPPSHLSFPSLAPLLRSRSLSRSRTPLNPLSPIPSPSLVPSSLVPRLSRSLVSLVLSSLSSPRLSRSPVCLVPRLSRALVSLALTLSRPLSHLLVPPLSSSPSFFTSHPSPLAATTLPTLRLLPDTPQSHIPSIGYSTCCITSQQDMPSVARCAQQRLCDSNPPTVSVRNPYNLLKARRPHFSATTERPSHSKRTWAVNTFPGRTLSARLDLIAACSGEYL